MMYAHGTEGKSAQVMYTKKSKSPSPSYLPPSPESGPYQFLVISAGVKLFM